MYFDEEINEPSSYEIERGKPSPSKLKSIVLGRLALHLDNHCLDFETFIGLSLDTPGEESAPDISICEKVPIDFSVDEIKRKVPPLATIEILSANQFLEKVLEKKNEYFSFGVKSCWVVLPRLKTIYVFSAP